MSIHGSEGQDNNIAQPANPVLSVNPNTINQPAGGATAKPAAKSWSFHNAGLFAAPIGRGLGSDYLLKLNTALAEIYKSANPDVELTLLTMDNVNDMELAFSTIVTCMRLKSDPRAGVAYHLLIVEATGKKITPAFETINGTQVEIITLTGAAFDDVLLAKANEVVRKAFPNVPCYMVDGCVIPRNFNPEDKYHIHTLALNAGLAMGTELELRRPDFEDFNIASARHDSNLVVNIGFSAQQMEDAVGEPMRSDVLINFTSQKQNAQNQRNTSVNSGDRESRIGELSAFVDLVWAPLQQGPAFNPYAPVQQQQTQKYAARAIITNLASSFSFTPASVLLSIATAISLRDDNNWIQAFRPIHTPGNEVDLHDIGALNIEANLNNDPSGFGTRIDTKSDSFKLEDLGQLVAALIQPGLVISLDIPECGPQSWYTSFLASGAVGAQGGYDAIYGAAQELTNGNFAKYFQNGQPIFTDLGNRVHLGHWTDRHGVRRDIRDIDYLAVANLVGDRTPQEIRDWSDTFTRTNYPLAMRLAARKRTIMGLTNDTAEFTGFAQRVTFTGQFMDALTRGCKDAGLNVRINTPLSSSDFNNQRGVAGFVGSALIQPGQSFMSRDSGFQQQYSGMGYHNYRY